jgi:creatinine amidohydrolase
MRADGKASPVRCRMVMWAGSRARALGDELYPGVNGSHATAAEVSLSQFYHKEAIKQAQMSPKVAPPGVPFHDCFDYRRRYPDGRIGSDPPLSTPEHGERIFGGRSTTWWRPTKPS